MDGFGGRAAGKAFKGKLGPKAGKAAVIKNVVKVVGTRTMA